jgi:hypothetical protein
MCAVWSAVFVAEEVGAGLGECEVLLGAVSAGCANALVGCHTPSHQRSRSLCRVPSKEVLVIPTGRHRFSHCRTNKIRLPRPDRS